MAKTPTDVVEFDIPKPDLTHIITEDDTPVDNIFSEKQPRLLTESLYTSWQGPDDDERKFVALANVGLFFVADNKPLVPDVLVSLDVELPEELWEKHHRSYFVWEYGKPPEVVIEIVSNRKGNEDGDKLQRYAQQGIAYYVEIDPDHNLSNQTLRLYERHGARYVEREDHWMPEMNLGLLLWEGVYEGKKDMWLRWCDLHDNLVATGAEKAAQEKDRADRLAAKLRELGVDPDSV